MDGMQILISEDGEVSFDPDFIDQAEADALFTRLRSELAWNVEHYTIYGRQVTAPRLVCWYGDAGANYRYSGVDHTPRQWTGTLHKLKARVEARVGGRFNSVLGNLYRNGQDSMGWHADKEPELGPLPLIASLSLGATRVFKLKHNRSGRIVEIPLQHGSLLCMAGRLQQCWKHAVPRRPGIIGERINLTFRAIVTANGVDAARTV